MGGMDGLDGEGEEGVGNVLDGMMRQLMTREILMEPLGYFLWRRRPYRRYPLHDNRFVDEILC
jgi:hypothetical protein